MGIVFDDGETALFSSGEKRSGIEIEKRGEPTKTKKVFVMLLTAVMMLCAVSLGGWTVVELPGEASDGMFHIAHAAKIIQSGNCGVISERTGKDGSQVRWTLDENGTVTVFGKGEIRSFSDNSPFYHNPAVKNVVIQRGINCIGGHAFEGCENLENVSIPETVTFIDNFAFKDCLNLKGLQIPDGVQAVSTGAFSGCAGLSFLSLPKSLTTLFNAVFEGCSGLEKITVDKKNPAYYSVDNCLINRENGCLELGCKNSMIPTDGSVNSIGTDAFAGCVWLTSLTIPASVTLINTQWQPFRGCTALEMIMVSPDNPVYYSVNNCVINRERGYLAVGCKTSAIPSDESVKSIGHMGFRDCDSLKKIIIPASVTNIDPHAFMGCDGLESVTLSEGVESIDEAAFDGCPLLKAVFIPENVSEIAVGAFPEQTVIYGYAGSSAQQWAERWNREFRLLSELTGDTDFDGEITPSDARLALRASVKLEDYAEVSAQTLAADVNKDGNITPEDARTILRASVDLETLS